MDDHHDPQSRQNRYAGADRRQPPTKERRARSRALVSIGDRSLAGEVGAEVGEALTQALALLDEILRTGHVGRQGLHAMRNDIERARHVAQLGQMVSRLAAGVASPTPESVALPGVLHAAAASMADEATERGLELHAVLGRADIVADTSLTFTLLQCLLRWAFQHGRDTVRLRTGMASWPVQAQLQLAFVRARPAGDTLAMLDDEGRSEMDTVGWRLVEQAASALGAQVQREESGQDIAVTIGFPETSRRWPKLVAGDAAAAAPDDDPMPLAGCRVLLLSARAELQRAAQTALVPQGAMLTMRPDAPDEPGLAEQRPRVLVVDAQHPGASALARAWGAGSGRGAPALLRIEEGMSGIEAHLGPQGELLRMGAGTALRDLPLAVLYASRLSGRTRA